MARHDNFPAWHVPYWRGWRYNGVLIMLSMMLQQWHVPRRRAKSTDFGSTYNEPSMREIAQRNRDGDLLAMPLPPLADIYAGEVTAARAAGANDADAYF